VVCAKIFGDYAGPKIFVYVMTAVAMSCVLPFFIDYVIVNFLGYLYALLFYSV
jgi:hypothetical protein